MWPILKEAAGDILRYVIQMLPCALAGAGLFFALLPLRRRRLARRGLRSPAPREGALLVFVLFCAGLAALTVFPSNLWSYVLEPGRWPEGTTFWSFYPTWEELTARLQRLPEELPDIAGLLPVEIEAVEDILDGRTAEGDEVVPDAQTCAFCRLSERCYESHLNLRSALRDNPPCLRGRTFPSSSSPFPQPA